MDFGKFSPERREALLNGVLKGRSMTNVNCKKSATRTSNQFLKLPEFYRSMVALIYSRNINYFGVYMRPTIQDQISANSLITVLSLNLKLEVVKIITVTESGTEQKQYYNQKIDPKKNLSLANIYADNVLQELETGEESFPGIFPTLEGENSYELTDEELNRMLGNDTSKG